MKYIKTFEKFKLNENHMDDHEFNHDFSSSEDFDIDKVLNSYLETALWAEGGDDSKMDSKSILDIDNESKEESKKDIIDFIKKAEEIAPEELKTYNEESLGHNIWLSRNGHGAGFFDDNNDQLQDIAREMDSKYIYVGDDDVVYIT